ncbi:RNA-binding protein YRA1 KNAG_0C04740 [Huiozyma naganishii CBS 8797]|uniref:RRM domain-containing protein n=1 Tax=Huiozyma naganishii (strain ATCC MYA-139 / BCRC 22969 / CBS 8797 / KCTC 17520 / NBRC 10181 / NCYC 3082 / Yp74L-3) TaxID=1071383 RepID=J7R414_HUIN7|nr:hypothetical protein KNAG_0C04740 [Kazachstania naganishii CBS 8797]CCK69575.1 hypothetical protein KNAG_0C04740 [Kazachstania naganishii CBS 8797]
MSANLDQSLDEIIGKRPNRATSRSGGARGNGPKRATKQVNVNRRGAVGRAVPRNVRAPASAVARVAKVANGSGAVKVNVEGLPRDIKQDAVREFFATHIGGVSGVLLSYNERGLSTGMANITFRNAELARRAVTKFNNAPIDNGRSRLRLNLIVSPTMQSQDLSRRIQALPLRAPLLRRMNVVQNKPKVQKVNAPNKKAAAAKKQKQQKKAKPAKKSLEDLDKEMADYFEEKK